MIWEDDNWFKMLNLESMIVCYPLLGDVFIQILFVSEIGEFIRVKSLHG